MWSLGANLLACDSQKTGCLALGQHRHTKYYVRRQLLNPRACIRARENSLVGVYVGRRAAWMAAKPAPNVSFTLRLIC